MSDSIKAILEKLKIKEVFGMCIIAGAIITFIPENFAEKLHIDAFKDKYQLYISILMIVAIAYYLMMLGAWLKKKIMARFFGVEKRGKKYLRDIMTSEEMDFLVEKFYDSDEKRFIPYSYIEMNDGRGAGLLCYHIMYRSANVSYYTSFAYNLQPWAVDYLNKNLTAGNIKIAGDSVKYKLK